MKDKDIISKGPKKRDPACLQVQADIIISKGTILRQEPGKEGAFSCLAAGGSFSISDDDATKMAGYFKRVIA